MLRRHKVLLEAFRKVQVNIILIEEGERFFPLSDDRAQHIRKVLRLGEGDSFRCGIVNSKEGSARITKIGDDGISFTFSPESDTSALYPVTLIVGQTRPICMRRILRESASLGAERIILPVTDLGEKSYSSSSLYTSGEYRKILLDGAMQAGRTGVSACMTASSLEEALELLTPSELLLLDNVIGEESLSSLDLRDRNVTLAIGPERGWSARERKVLVERGFKPVLLGSRILRTETAVSASLAVALSKMGLL